MDSFAFGDSPELADRLLALVLSGRKTATCWADRDGPQTTVGKRMVVRDGTGRSRAILETIALDRCRFMDVDAAFALAEGEGDLTLDSWRAAHQAYFERTGGFAPEMMLWCEHFRLIEVIDD